MDCERINVSQSLDGDESTSESEDDSSPFRYRQVFEQLFPYYLSIGMSYEQYWNDDSSLVKAYRKADEMRRIRKNSELWLQGKYVYDAICAVSPVLHAFAKAGTSPIPYTEEPYPITQEQVKEREKREMQKQRERTMAMMDSITKSINANFEGKESDSNGRCNN